MLNIRDLRIDPASLGKEMLLVDIIPMYEYRDNCRTDNLVAHRYIVSLPEQGLETLSERIYLQQQKDKTEG